MLIITPATLIFFSSLIISSLIAIARTNWVMAWVSIEINLLRFIPIITASGTNQETEARIKYFLAQALGSAVMLLSRLSIWRDQNKSFIGSILILSLLIKLGAAPCHFWFPSVITSLSWVTSLLLVTWQKLAPLRLLAFPILAPKSLSRLLVAVAGINAILGGLLGLNQTHLRTLLAYSSITHIGWIIGAISIASSLTSLLYFIAYSAIVFPLFILLNATNVVSPTQFTKSDITIVVLMLLLLLSLGGLPPLTGFLPKWMVITIIQYHSVPLLITLIIGSLINLYFYLNIAFFILLSSLANSSKLTSKIRILSLPLVLAWSGLGLAPILLYAMTLLN